MKLLWRILIDVCAMAWLLVTVVPQWLYFQSLVTVAQLLSDTAWLCMRGTEAIAAHLERFE